MKISMRVLSGLLFLLVTTLANGQQTPLTVQKIMQDPKWIGHFPKNPYWSEDSRWIYYYWNPENADADSLYRVSAAGGQPEKVSLKAQKNAPSPAGVYSRDFSKKLLIRDGDIFLHDIKRKNIRRLTATNARERNAMFNRDETEVLFQSGNSLFSLHIASGVLRELVQFVKGKKPKDTPQPGTAIEKYLQHEELALIRTLSERKAKRDKRVQARKLASQAPPKIYTGDFTIRNPMLSPDGKYVTVRLQKSPRKPLRTKVPNYVNETGFTKELNARPKVGSPGTIYKFAFVDLAKDTLIYVSPDSLPGIFEVPKFTHAPEKKKKPAGKKNKTGKQQKGKKQKGRDVSIFGPYWNQNGTRAFVVVRSLDNKDRWIAALNLPDPVLQPMERQHDEAWVGGPNIYGWNVAGAVGWMPDNQRIWFCSEETGFSHLYTYDVVSETKTALTAGRFEIYNPQISRDKKSWYFTANKVHPGERHYYKMPLAGGAWQQLTSMPGNNQAQVSPDGKKLLIRRSFMNQPWELYVQNARSGADARQLTFSTTDAWRAYPWRIPEIVRIPASDGAKPYARLYRPKSPNGAGVIFVHGAGYLQNAHKWWSSYFREYMFHNLLAEQGYTVLDIDYRGSAGYGRDWRTAIYRHMGGKDLDDQVDGAKYLVKALAVNADRIGIYGGSYGGFITLMAMFTKADFFKSGAALRSVTDWAHYNHPYTSNILNIPQADTLAFRQSSPIYFAEGLKGNLLICHGIVDTNVHFQDVVRLAQRLIELGKENWEFAVYPLESHGFVEPSSWTDEYRRILKLFNTTLR